MSVNKKQRSGPAWLITGNARSPMPVDVALPRLPSSCKTQLAAVTATPPNSVHDLCIDD